MAKAGDGLSETDFLRGNEDCSFNAIGSSAPGFHDPAGIDGEDNALEQQEDTGAHLLNKSNTKVGHSLAALMSFAVPSNLVWASSVEVELVTLPWSLKTSPVAVGRTLADKVRKELESVKKTARSAHESLDQTVEAVVPAEFEQREEMMRKSIKKAARSAHQGIDGTIEAVGREMAPTIEKAGKEVAAGGNATRHQGGYHTQQMLQIDGEDYFHDPEFHVVMAPPPNGVLSNIDAGKTSYVHGDPQAPACLLGAIAAGQCCLPGTHPESLASLPKGIPQVLVVPYNWEDQAGLVTTTICDSSVGRLVGAKGDGAVAAGHSAHVSVAEIYGDIETRASNPIDVDEKTETMNGEEVDEVDRTALRIGLPSPRMVDMNQKTMPFDDTDANAVGENEEEEENGGETGGEANDPRNASMWVAIPDNVEDDDSTEEEDVERPLRLEDINMSELLLDDGTKRASIKDKKLSLKKNELEVETKDEAKDAAARGSPVATPSFSVGSSHTFFVDDVNLGTVQEDVDDNETEDSTVVAEKAIETGVVDKDSEALVDDAKSWMCESKSAYEENQSVGTATLAKAQKEQPQAIAASEEDTPVSLATVTAAAVLKDRKNGKKCFSEEEENTVGGDELPPPPGSMPLSRYSRMSKGDEEDTMRLAEEEEEESVLLNDDGTEEISQVISAADGTPVQVREVIEAISEDADDASGSEVNDSNPACFFTDEKGNRIVEHKTPIQIMDAVEVDGGIVFTPKGENQNLSHFARLSTGSTANLLPRLPIDLDDEDEDTVIQQSSMIGDNTIDTRSTFKEDARDVWGKVAKKKASLMTDGPALTKQAAKNSSILFTPNNDGRADPGIRAKERVSLKDGQVQAPEAHVQCRGGAEKKTSGKQFELEKNGGALVVRPICLFEPSLATANDREEQDPLVIRQSYSFNEAVEEAVSPIGSDLAKELEAEVKKQPLSSMTEERQFSFKTILNEFSTDADEPKRPPSPKATLAHEDEKEMVTPLVTNISAGSDVSTGGQRGAARMVVTWGDEVKMAWPMLNLDEDNHVEANKDGLEMWTGGRLGLKSKVHMGGLAHFDHALDKVDEGTKSDTTLKLRGESHGLAPGVATDLGLVDPSGTVDGLVACFLAILVAVLTISHLSGWIDSTGREKKRKTTKSKYCCRNPSLFCYALVLATVTLAAAEPTKTPVLDSDTVQMDVKDEGNKKVTSANANEVYSYNMSEGARRLEEKSRGQLRGNKGSVENPVEAVVEAKEILESQLNHLKATREQLESGNDEEASALIALYLDDTQAAAKIAAHSSSLDEDDQDLVEALKALSSDDYQLDRNDLGDLADSAHISSKELASAIVDEAVLDHMQATIDTLEDVISGAFPSYSRHRRTSSNNAGQHSSPFPSGLQGFSATPKLPGKLGRVKLPKLKAVEQLKNLRAVKGGENHLGRRLQEERPAQCAECQDDDFTCNCRRLFDCAKNLSWYDMAVRNLGGFVESEPDSDFYGQLTTEDMEDINVFDARDDLGPKIGRIRNLADGEMTEDSCLALLSEFHTACEEESCTDPNRHSFQLSVDEVCDAVDTRAKLSVDVMGQFYDFRRWAVQPSDGVRQYGDPLVGQCQRGGQAYESLWKTLEESGGLPEACINFCAPYRDNAGYRGFQYEIFRFDVICYCLFDKDTVPTLNIPDGANTATSPPRAIGEVDGTSANSEWECHPFMSPPPEEEETPLNTKRAVRCCRTDEPPAEERDVWPKSPVGIGGCPFTLDQMWTSELPKTPTTAPDGYTGYPGRKCKDENQFDDTDLSLNLGDCASRCDSEPNCVSFYLNATTCRRSTSCDHYSLTESDDGSTWYFKHHSILPVGYTKYPEIRCLVAEHDTQYDNIRTPQECANLCSADSSCVSFAYHRFGRPHPGRCWLSSTCTNPTVDTAINFDWYLKSEDNDDDECVFLTHGKAEEFCAERGGRLCTKSELENNCAAFTGCGFDTQLVWSASEAEPAVCPATSFSSCGEFVTEFDSLYDARNRTMFPDASPMRIDPTQAVLSDFTNVRFPTGFSWEVKSLESQPVDHGVVSIKDYLYGYDTILSNQDDLFCDAQLGPPSELARACDDSMNFLLGRPVSIGLLTSTAKAVNDFGQNQNPSPKPRWYQWYTSLKDVNVIEFVDEWTGVYNNISDPEGDPSWLEWYLSVRDENPFILPQLQGEQVYCVDPDISGLDSERTLRDCQKDWLTDESNRYDFSAAYENTLYPTFRPYNESSCGYVACQLEWMEGSNPFDEVVTQSWLRCGSTTDCDLTEYKASLDENHGVVCCSNEDLGLGWSQNQQAWTTENCPYSLNVQEVPGLTCAARTYSESVEFCESQGGRICTSEELHGNCAWSRGCGYSGSLIWAAVDDECYDFYNYCRVSHRELFQCERFWDHCRAELSTHVAYWEYPKQTCESHPTCQLDWLSDETNRFSPDTNLACFEFWQYCRDQLNATYPEYQWPQPYCNNDRDLTCQEEWLNDEANPFSLESDKECHLFWEYCHTQLILTHPRYEWPPFRDPVVDDFMPGYCCLDTPTDTSFSSEFWGTHYTAARSDRGMECQNRGEWHMGMSPEACANGGGQFFRTPCITLHRCIDARPREGESGYKPIFEEWVTENEVDIYNPGDEAQCEQAREALGYEGTHLDDHEICDTFNELMCDEFFEDLQFLADDDGPAVFDSVTYTPVEYPPDAPLYFKKLPRKDNPDKGKAQKVKDDEEGKITALKDAKFGLQITKDHAYDILKKTQDKLKSSYYKKQTACDIFIASRNRINDKLEVVEGVCKSLVFVAFGKSNPKANVCDAKANAIRSTTLLPARIKADACEMAAKKLNIIARDVAQLVLWAVIQAVKISYTGVSKALEDKSIKPYQELKGYYFSEATYYKLKSLDEWTVESLETINVNLNEQHVQMRQELQDRHQDITNDVNQFTTCMSNYLGIQIFNALPDARAGPLSSLCSTILGVSSSSGRRLEEATPDPFTLEIDWGPDSMPRKQDKILANEETIIGIEREIMEEVAVSHANEEAIMSMEQEIINAMQSLQSDVAQMKTWMEESGTSRSKAKKKAKNDKTTEASNLFGAGEVENEDEHDQASAGGEEAPGEEVEAGGMHRLRKLESNGNGTTEKSVAELIMDMSDKMEVIKDEMGKMKDVMGEMKVIKDEMEKMNDKMEDTKVMKDEMGEMKAMIGHLIEQNKALMLQNEKLALAVPNTSNEK